MAELSPKNLHLLLHSISSNSPFSRSHQLTFPIIRFTPLRRRSQLSHSSTSLPAGLDIVSTSEQSDGSVIFMFGNAAQNSRKNADGVDAEPELVGGSDDGEDVNYTSSELVGGLDDGQDVNCTNLEVVGALDGEQEVSYTNSELVGGLADEHEVELERGSVSDADIGEVDVIDSKEVECNSIRKDEEKHDNEGDDSAERKAEESKGSDVRDLENGDSELEENVLGSFTQVGELVGSTDYRTELQSSVQSNVDCTKDEQNYGLISTVEIETKHDGEGSSVTISDSIVDFVVENSNDSEKVKSERVDSLVTTLDFNADLIIENLEKIPDDEFVVAVSTSQLQPDGNGLQEIAETSSRFEVSEPSVSLDESELEGNGKHVGNGGDEDSVILEIAETNSVIRASEMGVSLEDDELESNLKQFENEEKVDDKSQEIIDVNSLIEASNKNVEQFEVSEPSVSLNENELGGNGKHVGNGGDDDSVMLEIAETNSVIRASEMGVLLEDDELESNLKQFENEENVDDKSQEIIDVNSLIEASNKNVEQFEVSEPSVSLDENELGGNGKHVDNGGDDDSVMLEIAETNSVIRASEMGVLLEDDELESNLKQFENEENVDDKSQEIIDVNSLIEASNKNVEQFEVSEPSVSLDENELGGNGKHVGNGGDDDSVMLEIAETNSVIRASEMGVLLEDDELESNLKQFENEENVDDKSQEIIDVNSLIEASDKNVEQVANEENVNGKSQKIVDENSLIEASNRNVKQMENEENIDDDQSQEIVDMNSLIEALDSNIKLVVSEEDSLIEALDMGVSLGDDELDNNVKHVGDEEDVGNDMLELSQKEASQMSVSLNISELDCNEAHMVNEDDDLVELMEKSIQLEAEPIPYEKASCDSGYNAIIVESTSVPSMVDDAAPSVSLLSDDVLFDDDISEATSLDVLDIAMPKANVDSMSSDEITTPMLYLSSAAASLPHSSENSWGQSINHVALTEGGMDAYFVCENWFGVADGVGQWSFGGTDRGRYAHELMQNCEKVALNSRTAGLTDVKDALQQIAAMTESSGAARVLIAHFANHALHVANIGDTGFVIVRNGKIFKKSSPMVHEFNFPYAMGSGVDPLEALEEYHIDLEDGDVIVAATDGLFDNLYEQEIGSVLSKSLGARMELKELAELLVTIAQELGSSAHGRSPFADAAQAAGHTGVVGGKLDNVTVIVSLVQTSK